MPTKPKQLPEALICDNAAGSELQIRIVPRHSACLLNGTISSQIGCNISGTNRYQGLLL